MRIGRVTVRWDAPYLAHAVQRYFKEPDPATKQAIRASLLGWAVTRHARGVKVYDIGEDTFHKLYVYGPVRVYWRLR